MLQKEKALRNGFDIRFTGRDLIYILIAIFHL